MKREKTLTKKERKALQGKGPSGARGAGGGQQQHIHCVACGRHIEPTELTGAADATAVVVTCQHGSQFAACLGCQVPAQKILDEHDRTGQPVKAAAAWH